MTCTPSAAQRPTARMAGDLVTRGAVAGAVAGLVFILANMIQATTQGMPAIAPFLAISTVFHFSDMPVMNPNEVVVGLMTHFGLSVLFGVVFAIAVLPWLRNPAQLVVAVLVYGLLLYVVNFQILGRLVFDFFQNPHGPNQVFELIVHPLAFGLPLIPFFLGWTGMLSRKGALSEPGMVAPAVGRGEHVASR